MLFPSQLQQHHEHLWFHWSSNLLPSNIQIQTTCSHTKHPEDNKSSLEVSRTNKVSLSPKSKVSKLQCVPLNLMRLCTHYWTNCYGRALWQTDWQANHSTPWSHAWEQAEVVPWDCYKKEEWMMHNRDNGCPLKMSPQSSLLSCLSQIHNSSLNIVDRFWF